MKDGFKIFVDKLCEMMSNEVNISDDDVYYVLDISNAQVINGEECCLMIASLAQEGCGLGDILDRVTEHVEMIKKLKEQQEHDDHIKELRNLKPIDSYILSDWRLKYLMMLQDSLVNQERYEDAALVRDEIQSRL